MYRTGPEVPTDRLKLPEEAIHLPDVTIGGMTPKQLEEALFAGRFRVSSWARALLRSRDFTTLPDRQTLSLVKVKVSDLYLTANPTTDQILVRANSLGLELCPAEVGPHLRLIFKYQRWGEWLHIGMKPLSDTYSDPSIFKIGQRLDGMWIDSRWARNNRRWKPDDQFVFSSKK